MRNLFGSKKWFEDFSDDTILFIRRSHDDDPAHSYPLVMMYDPEALIRAKQRGLSRIGIITAEFNTAVSEARMPNGDLVMQLRSALDQRLSDVCAAAKAKANLIATQTGGGARQYFLFVDDISRLDLACSHVSAPGPIAINVWEHDDPASLLNWFLPVPLESMRMSDDRLRQVFADRGDDVAIERDARFFFYGGDVSALSKAAEQLGFKTGISDDAVTIWKDMSIAPDTLDALNRTFLEWIDAFGVTYDGWEAALLVEN